MQKVYAYCPIIKGPFELNDNNARIEPCNLLTQTLVIDCACGRKHYQNLPFVLSNSALEIKREEALNRTPRALIEPIATRIKNKIKTFWDHFWASTW